MYSVYTADGTAFDLAVESTFGISDNAAQLSSNDAAIIAAVITAFKCSIRAAIVPTDRAAKWSTYAIADITTDF